MEKYPPKILIRLLFRQILIKFLRYPWHKMTVFWNLLLWSHEWSDEIIRIKWKRCSEMLFCYRAARRAEGVHSFYQIIALSRFPSQFSHHWTRVRYCSNLQAQTNPADESFCLVFCSPSSFIFYSLTPLCLLWLWCLFSLDGGLPNIFFYNWVLLDLICPFHKCYYKIQT